MNDDQGGVVMKCTPSKGWVGCEKEGEGEATGAFFG